MTDKAGYLLLALIARDLRRHERLAEDEAVRFVERCARRIERAVALFDGRLLRAGNGEAMAVFAEADQAVLAAREMQQRVSELPPQSGVAVALRVGIACAELSESAELASAGAAVLDTQTPCAGAAARLAGLAQPGQVLLSGTTRDRLTPPMQARTQAFVAADAAGERDFVLDGGPPAAPVPVPTPAVRLVLHYAGRRHELDATKPRLCIGRDAGNDVEIDDRRASRRHATLERRGDTVWLIDHSSNGSYVTLAGQAEVYVRARELALYGAGVIRFAASAAPDGAGCARFEVIGGGPSRRS